MEAREQLKQHITSRAVDTFSKEFLTEIQDRIGRAYVGTYDHVAHDKTVLKEQKIHKLRQDRCFRMDFELSEIATKFGLQNTAKKLPENDWAFAYVVNGDFGFTQSYVQKIGDLPNPAKYREQFAESARVPRLSLENDSEFYKPRNFYGLFAHNPIGAKFDEDSQKLGSLQFCVPFMDMKGWALEISVPELISLFPSVSKTPLAKSGPTWKTPAEKKQVKL
ncbi:MAG: hypothetical protein Salg2KO_21090 [Salibacteraceae bacterium]